MKTKTPFKVFIQEDDLNQRKVIAEELKLHDYRITFFSKEESMFDLLQFNPDIFIKDYRSEKIYHCHKW